MRLLARTVRCLQGGGGPAARARGATRLSRDLRSAAGGSPGRAARTLETPGKRTPAASRACCRRSGRSGAARARRPSRSSTAAGRRASLGPKPRRLQGATSRRKMMTHLAGAEQRREAAARPGGLRPAPRPACAPGRPRRRRHQRRSTSDGRLSSERLPSELPGTERRNDAPPERSRPRAAPEEQDRRRPRTGLFLEPLLPVALEQAVAVQARGPRGEDVARPEKQQDHADAVVVERQPAHHPHRQKIWFTYHAFESLNSETLRAAAVTVRRRGRRRRAAAGVRRPRVADRRCRRLENRRW